MEPETAAAVNEHLGLAFDHLREAIMLAIAGEPTGEVGGAIGRLERFVASGGDTSVLMEGLPSDAQQFISDTAGLFSDEELAQAKADVEGLVNVEAEEDDLEAKRAFNPAFEGDEGDEEDDEFSGLFDDIDEEESDDDPSDAPAAF